MALKRPHVAGMGFRTGIALIFGGGFHGKSSILEEMQVGVYKPLPDDGRGFVCVVLSLV